MIERVRPADGETITLLFEVDGVPITDVTVANRVRDASMIVPRGDVGVDAQIATGVPVTAIFVADRRLYRWPMRIEEVLPSSYFLVSVSEPGIGERREFVRADVELTVRITGDDAPAFDERVAVDVSASGLRLVRSLGFAVGSVVDVCLTRDDGSTIAGRAQVVRGDAGALACEFVELATADENRLIGLVFEVRARELNQRIGVDLGG